MSDKPMRDDPMNDERLEREIREALRGRTAGPASHDLRRRVAAIADETPEVASVTRPTWRGGRVAAAVATFGVAAALVFALVRGVGPGPLPSAMPGASPSGPTASAGTLWNIPLTTRIVGDFACGGEGGCRAKLVLEKDRGPVGNNWWMRRGVTGPFLANDMWTSLAPGSWVFKVELWAASDVIVNGSPESESLVDGCTTTRRIDASSGPQLLTIVFNGLSGCSISLQSDAAANPSGSPASIGKLDLQVHTIPAEWAAKAGHTVANDGTTLAWASQDGADGSGQPYAPDLVAVDPVSGRDPHYVIRLPNRDSSIAQVAVRNGRFAFVEQNAALLGMSGWRLWSLESEGADPILLDEQVTSSYAVVPELAMTENGVAWTRFGEVDGVTTSEVRAASADGSGRRTLLGTRSEAPTFEKLSTDPAGRTLYFTHVRRSGDAQIVTAERLDLATPQSTPVDVGQSNIAGNPVSNGSVTAWLYADGGVWDSLRTSGASAALDLRGASDNEPLVGISIGNRFVAYQVMGGATPYVYDLVDGETKYVGSTPPTLFTGQVEWTRVAGDLLVFRRQSIYDASAGKPMEICWVVLPSMP